MAGWLAYTYDNTIYVAPADGPARSLTPGYWSVDW